MAWLTRCIQSTQSFEHNVRHFDRRASPLCNCNLCLRDMFAFHSFIHPYELWSECHSSNLIMELYVYAVVALWITMRVLEIDTEFVLLPLILLLFMHAYAGMLVCFLFLHHHLYLPSATAYHVYYIARLLLKIGCQRFRNGGAMLWPHFYFPHSVRTKSHWSIMWNGDRV